MPASQFAGQKWFWISVGVIIFVTGCAMVPVPTVSIHTGRGDQLGDCADFFKALDERIVQSQAIESHPFRVRDFPIYGWTDFWRPSQRE